MHALTTEILSRAGTLDQPESVTASAPESAPGPFANSYDSDSVLAPLAEVDPPTLVPQEVASLTQPVAPCHCPDTPQAFVGREVAMQTEHGENVYDRLVDQLSSHSSQQAALVVADVLRDARISNRDIEHMLQAIKTNNSRAHLES